MKWLRPITSLGLMVPAGAILGYWQSGGWVVATVAGGLVGVLVGLMFGGDPRWRIWNQPLGPDDRPTGGKRSRERYGRAG